jgi:hypothetical protein
MPLTQRRQINKGMLNPQQEGKPVVDFREPMFIHSLSNARWHAVSGCDQTGNLSTENRYGFESTPSSAEAYQKTTPFRTVV